MQPLQIRQQRLASQHIAESRCRRVGDVVASLGAVQAQDYPGALWSLALRTPGATESDVLAAIKNRRILRTWPMRGTLHFVPAADARWMLALLTPRIIAGSARRYQELELDDKIFSRCHKLFNKRLQGGGTLSRPGMFAALNEAGIATGSQRGYHILSHLSMTGVLCFAEHAGRQPSFALLDEWVDKSVSLNREESLALLAQRYFTSHGPATLADFAWWSGLTLKEARQALELAKPSLQEANHGDVAWWFSPDAACATKPEVHLLPGFDEYLLGYTDRTAVLDPAHASRIVPGNNGMFMPTLILDGRVAGIWKRNVKKNSVMVNVTPFQPLRVKDQKALGKAAEKLAAFGGLPVTLHVDGG